MLYRELHMGIYLFNKILKIYKVKIGLTIVNQGKTKTRLERRSYDALIPYFNFVHFEQKSYVIYLSQKRFFFFL